MTIKEFEGDRYTDDRGYITAINSFNPTLLGVQRIYRVRNHKVGTVRAWHAHAHERKWVTALTGAAVIGIVELDDLARASQNLSIARYVLSGDQPKILMIPAGCANGAMNLTEDTELMYFSDKNLQESTKDDYRYPPRYWDCWEVIER